MPPPPFILCWWRLISLPTPPRQWNNDYSLRTESSLVLRKSSWLLRDSSWLLHDSSWLLRESSWVFLRPTVVMNGLIISFSVAVNGAQNFLTLVYFLCSVCMLLNSQMAEINGNYIFPKFKSDFFIILIFFYKGMVCEPEFFKAINSRTSLTE